MFCGGACSSPPPPSIAGKNWVGDTGPSPSRTAYGFEGMRVFECFIIFRINKCYLRLHVYAFIMIAQSGNCKICDCKLR